jgi:hypothetical protein
MENKSKTGAEEILADFTGFEDMGVQVEFGDDDDSDDNGFIFGEEPEEDDCETDTEIAAALGELVAGGSGGISNPTHYDDEDDEQERADFYAREGIMGCDDCALGLCDCGYDFD